jgi:hypothetical protein
MVLRIILTGIYFILVWGWGWKANESKTIKGRQACLKCEPTGPQGLLQVMTNEV